jgi:hypothetical protein
MNYQIIYDQLIQKRKDNPVVEGYKENHHILPKSLCGEDTKENLVSLTGREHWIAHLLLHKIHKCSQTAHACNMMAMRCEERGIPKIKNSRMYEWVRKEHGKYISKITKKRIGNKNGSFGTIWICNLELKENKKIKKEEEIPEGWIKGRNKWKYTPDRKKIGTKEHSKMVSEWMKQRREAEESERAEYKLKLSKAINKDFLESGYNSFSKFALDNHKKYNIGYGSMYKYKNLKVT